MFSGPGHSANYGRQEMDDDDMAVVVDRTTVKKLANMVVTKDLNEKAKKKKREAIPEW